MNQQDRLNNELLVLRCQEGDLAAFEQLVVRWQQWLWRHAWRLTGDENAAWDALQETWIDISRGLADWRSRPRFPPGPVRSSAISAATGWPPATAPGNRPAILEEVQESYEPAREQQQQLSLKEALGQLSGSDRTILSLRYEDGFGPAEIARILEVPEGTVKSRLFYARKRLRIYLEKDDE